MGVFLVKFFVQWVTSMLIMQIGHILIKYQIEILSIFLWKHRGRHGCDRMVVDLQLPMQSVPITTDVVSLNLDQGEVYNIMW